MPRYDTADWIARGSTYLADFIRKPAYELQERAIVAALSEATGINTVLEVGCGFGRITRVIEELDRPDLYYATDTSPGMLASARDYLGPESRVLLNVLDLDEPGELGPFDLVLAVEVLMHRPPERIAADVAVLCAASQRWVLTCDWRQDRRRDIEGCYQHDYAALFSVHGTVREIAIPDAHQSIFVTRIAEVHDGPDR